MNFLLVLSVDINKARDIIKKAIEKCETVSKEKYIQIYVKSLSSNIEMEIYWWTKSKPRDIRKSCDEVLSHIKKALDKEKIEIPHSYTLSFQDALTVKKIKSSSKHEKIADD